ncbi:MAG: AraC family transcriptional regulator [Paenibacillus sp. RIFOXYA1_FULL_44_5]|nr:MAG: AraC family transcriptional regulator [Paenibacillus sp. RIFOXYA1_FULL_44_5]
MQKESYYVISNPSVQEKDDLQILFSGYSQTKPGHAIGPRVLDYYLIHYVEAGRGTFSVHGDSYTLSKGDCFIIEPEQLVGYAADLDEPWFYRWIACRGSKVMPILISAGYSAGNPVISFGENKTISRQFKNIIEALQKKRTSVNLEALGHFYLLLAQFQEALFLPNHVYLEKMSEQERKIKQAIHYLTTQYSEAMSIEMLADNLGYNRAYLSQIFKQYTGLSPVTFLLQIRLNKAKLLLRERKELTVAQVASSVGFEDPLHFSKQFKKLHGVSPNEYRKMIIRMEPT